LHGSGCTFSKNARLSARYCSDTNRRLTDNYYGTKVKMPELRVKSLRGTHTPALEKLKEYNPFIARDFEQSPYWNAALKSAHTPRRLTLVDILQEMR
jgi:hypothetical protein